MRGIGHENCFGKVVWFVWTEMFQTFAGGEELVVRTLDTVGAATSITLSASWARMEVIAFS